MTAKQYSSEAARVRAFRRRRKATEWQREADRRARRRVYADLLDKRRRKAHTYA